MAYGYTLSEEARHAYAAFADTPAVDVIERLVDEILLDPTTVNGPRKRKVGALYIWAVPSCGASPPIRIFFTFHHGLVQFLGFETYDELAAGSVSPGMDC